MQGPSLVFESVRPKLQYLIWSHLVTKSVGQTLLLPLCEPKSEGLGFLAHSKTTALLFMVSYSLF